MRGPSEHPKSTGQCLCGAVTFDAKGEPPWVAHCHCHSCRRNTGSAVATYVGFWQSQVMFSGRPRAFYRSSPGVIRGFCDRCGVPMNYDGDLSPGNVDQQTILSAWPKARGSSVRHWLSQPVWSA
ncbi:MAG: GFA family protein [Rhodospirillales bacterium]